MKPLCLNAPRPVPPLAPHVAADPHRASAILVSRSKWANGTVLHYCFFTKGKYKIPKAQADAVRNAFRKWKAVGIGLTFQEVAQLSEAEVRVGYSTAAAVSQSAVGRDVLDIPLNEPTTEYGWDLRTQYGSGTALHELGHVLGMEHEHQSPFAGIKWHEEAVYKALAEPPNRWSRAKTYENILEKVSPRDVEGSRWDPDSIMEYEFEPGLIDEPEKYDVGGLTPPGTLSIHDKAFVRRWYPPMKPNVALLQPFAAAVAELPTGGQMDYRLMPDESRKYTIETKGATDTLLVLFEEIDGKPRYVAGDDDSSQDRNARIVHKLFKGRTYIVRLRLIHPGQSGKTSLVYW
jgi:hypothetical protein